MTMVGDLSGQVENGKIIDNPTNGKVHLELQPPEEARQLVPPKGFTKRIVQLALAVQIYVIRKYERNVEKFLLEQLPHKCTGTD
ncbi:hypothetical protein J6590_048890 [Homalodisca vitripennis]|nr:hypothetical protein J6590_048890 [Homalodisca vitripennis]